MHEEKKKKIGNHEMFSLIRSSKKKRERECETAKTFIIVKVGSYFERIKPLRSLGAGWKMKAFFDFLTATSVDLLTSTKPKYTNELIYFHTPNNLGSIKCHAPVERSHCT